MLEAQLDTHRGASVVIKTLIDLKMLETLQRMSVARQGRRWKRDGVPHKVRYDIKLDTQSKEVRPWTEEAARTKSVIMVGIHQYR